jgi:hypothetical protein
VVIPFSLLKEACGEAMSIEDVEKLMLMQGYVSKTGDLYILIGDLDPGTAILTAAPKLVGTYTRSDTALALQFFRVDRAVVLVGREFEESSNHGVA